MTKAKTTVAKTASVPQHAQQPTEEIPEPKNVHEAINMVMGRVGYVQKQDAQGLPYKFAGEAAFIKAVRPHLVDVGLVVFQSGVELLGRYEFTAKSGALGINILAKFTWTWVHAVSETSIKVTTIGEAADYGDKAANKAMTAAMKYNMRQTLIIETGDDPDTTPSTDYEQPAKKKDAKKAKPAERTPFTAPVGKKEWPSEKAEDVRYALITAKVLPPDVHDKHVVMFLDLLPFGINVPLKEVVGWGKLYRGYKDETNDTKKAVDKASKRWFSGETK